MNRSDSDNAQFGFVYVLHNPNMDGLLKIGKTTRSPSLRAKELSRATGVPGAFSVVFFAEVEGYSILEQQLHERFVDHRVNGSEFFKVSLQQIRDEIARIMSESPTRDDQPCFVIGESVTIWGEVFCCAPEEALVLPTPTTRPVSLHLIEGQP
ncbi:GIY-YIG nuclease family protein [Stutzerimonas nitrititolerans]|uniref:GIY-YIG nuclease family protein n=1 Tax=Stutzerimonas nitrititolerans TaxID=2482751 RepID=UPI0028A74EBC|nr:GIY-YIG nuclease family protein [Stutzerimonas nitrititolerans]